jgi:HAD superfamily hydrolase (TIGR01509 family)
MSELRAVIFDVDGTLADTERDGHRLAFNHAFAEVGLDWDWDVSLYGDLLAVAGGKERIRFYLNNYKPDFAQPTHLDKFIADLHAAKTKHYQQLVANGAIPLRPGVKRLLEEARTNSVRLAITTTSALPNVIALLQQNLAPDAPEWFEVIAAGDIVPAKKPAPDIYEYVLQKMSLSAPDCIAIEDSLYGLQAATTVGIKTVITINDYTSSQDFTGAALVLNYLGEPEEPFTVIAGDAGDTSYLNLELLRRLHAK